MRRDEKRPSGLELNLRLWRIGRSGFEREAMAVSSKIEASLLPTRPSPVQDGGEGDDELGDDDSRDDDDEGEGEEEEPRLKYQRLGGSLPSLLSSDAAACLTRRTDDRSWNA